MSDQYETIKITKEDGITFVTFNRPEKRNAMSPHLHREMDEVLDELAVDPQTLVLVITGVLGLKLIYDAARGLAG